MHTIRSLVWLAALLLLLGCSRTESKSKPQTVAPPQIDDVRAETKELHVNKPYTPAK